MSKKAIKNIVKANVKAEKYILRLFITGILSNSARAVVNCTAICEKHLKDRYELEIIDIYQQPELALEEDLIAIPVLIRKFPLPEHRIIGDLSNIETVLKELGVV